MISAFQLNLYRGKVGRYCQTGKKTLNLKDVEILEILKEHISTSYVERQNLTMRMSMRRFTRLTNGFSKKLENHATSVALDMMAYNFQRKHMTLGTTPAVKAGIADHILEH